MLTQSGAEKDSAAGVMSSSRARGPWRVKEVQALPDYRLRVVFLDGLKGAVAMGGLVHSDQAGVFAALADPAHFAEARVENGVVTWPGEIDLAPDAMYAAIKKDGIWTLG
ncbi:MAG: DUF2442 domain-containing protein [Alphaproteobacteria bacterium]|nr:DUF2442 domain-containing protein [Alphaproteobacteria bacterium]